MSNQQQQQPVSVEEALKLFNEVQQLTVRDAQDNDRFDAASGGAAAGAAQRGNVKPGSNSAATAGGRTVVAAAGGIGGGVGRSGSSAGPITNEAELRRQVELSEAVMKKLHAKNKALTQEIEELKKKNAGGGSTSNDTPRADRKDSSAAHVEALQRKIAEQDATIESLMKANGGSNSSRALPGRPPLPFNNNSNINNSSKASAAKNNSDSDVMDDEKREDLRQQCALHEQRIAQLQQQVDQLTDIKLECIRDGESTGRVNKEVKAFFVTSRQKMIDDCAFFEAERSLLNQRLAKLEAEVLSLRLQNKP